MAKFRKKPVEIEARHFANPNHAPKIIEWVNFESGNHVAFLAIRGRGNPGINIETLEGTMTANVGDYIIRGVQGEFYPCKPDIFEATYDPVD